MKLKFSLGEGGLKGFFTQHAEKVIFGIVLGLVAFFVYTSATQEGLDDSRTPDDLKRQAASASKHIRDDFSDEIVPPREADVDDYPTRARAARSKIDEAGYTLPNPLDRKLIPPKTKRGDPELLAPIQLEVDGAVCTVATRAQRTDGDPWINDKAAVAKAEEQEKPKKRRKKKTRRPTAGGYGEAMLSGSGMYGSEGGEGGYNPYGSEYESEMAGSEEGMMSGPMGTAAQTGMGRKLDKFYIEHYIRGYRGSGGMGVGPAAGLGKSYAVVSVKALVPFEKQWEEYERVLANATGYSPSQDVPRYLMFVAQRAEVPADPNAELQWQTISYTQHALQQTVQYTGIAKEMADAAYILPGSLTMPIPPILLKPLDKFAVHSEIPRQQAKLYQAAKPKEVSKGPADPTEMDLSAGIPEMPKATPGGPGGYGMGGGYGSGSGMMPGYGEAMSSEGASYGMEGGSGYGMEGGSGYGMGGSSYGMEGGYGAMGGQPQQPMVKYKMIRFFDMTAEVGKSYRYRVAVILEDPNRPRDAKADPNRRILDSDARKRVEEWEAKDDDYNKKHPEYARQHQGMPKRTYYRQTDWSEPSDIVTIASPAKFVAGPAEKTKPITLPEGTTVRTVDANGNQVDVVLDKDTEVQTNESSGKLVTVVWDPKRAVEVPAEKEVYRGSYLTFEQDADVLQPMSLQLKTIEKYSFDTNAFVADFRCGGVLITDVDEDDKDEETKLYEPSEFLVVDGKGNLVACKEIDDTEEYRRLLFISDSADATAPTGGYGSGMEGDYGEMMGSGYGEMMDGGGEH